MNILFASAEAHPLIKTGGLADVAGSLPRAIRHLHHDIRIVIPAYQSVLKQAEKFTLVAHLELESVKQPVRILCGRLPGSNVTVYLVDSPEHFDRPGNPYTMKQGAEWPDNAERFTTFCRAIEALSLDAAGLDWQPDIIHCNDWQTALVLPLLDRHAVRPATIFTIHNLAYQGLFDWKIFKKLKLPADFWSMEAMEFHNQFSFIKGGLVYADWVTTVSPTYAEEIQTSKYGYGLEGLIGYRKDNLTGIVNGVDYNVWNPGRDILIPVQFTARSLTHKIENKQALQEHFKLPVDKTIPVFAVISRLVEQKGIDLILKIVPDLVKQKAQLIVLGSGDSKLETGIRDAVKKYPKQVAAHIGYDEALSHHIEAGADMFLMPSRFEPCGLNQIYSQRYGTVPIVRNTGGLADTVTDTTPETIESKTATGFSFNKAKAPALLKTVERALGYYRQPEIWQQIVCTGMKQDFSWKRSAQLYIELYETVLAQRDGKATAESV
ncbi:MAG TPA: glycogen synthase GlgA [Gammaproteobacteria bacterium]|nr:glycogen synthase GlgA [Gammaproteobacteria bacterium]